MKTSSCGRLGRFGGSWSGLQRRYDRFQFFQHILSGHNSGGMPLVIEAITAALQFSGFHSPVRSAGHYRCAGKVEVATYAPQVETVLLPGCPAEETGTPRVAQREWPSKPPVFARTDAIAV